ncbi:MAG: DUF4214 domain-containing protein [Candidatus Nanohaloarchaea archaeon]|nr:DUF4214 domain-containing protein [Candidatus Nanohaloarchaea archaeon]
MVEEQKRLIHDGDWDNLIILDACRYDYFEEFYDLFPNIDGRLQKVWSAGNNSAEFIEETFPDEYPYTVFSANPVMNNISDAIQLDGASGEYIPRQHFETIYPVFDSEWDEAINTVFPQDFNDYVRRHTVEGKTIFWYLQPHAPYIGTIKLGSDNHAFPGAIPTPGEILFDTGEFQGIAPDSPLAVLMRHAYKYTLWRVMYYVAELLPHLEGKTVITADHGELLTDDDNWGHPIDEYLGGGDRSKLREVPWLEVEGDLVDLHNMAVDRYIETVYRSVLDREPDEDGFETYKDKLENLSRFTRPILLETLIESDEFEDRFFDPNKIVRTP